MQQRATPNGHFVEWTRVDPSGPKCEPKLDMNGCMYSSNESVIAVLSLIPSSLIQLWILRVMYRL
jgi:hypothetical protein